MDSMIQPLSRDLLNTENSAYAFTVAISPEDHKSSEDSHFMNPEAETRMQFFEPSVQGMKDLLQLKQRFGDFLRYQQTEQDMRESIDQILETLNPSWYSPELVEHWIQSSRSYPQSEGMSVDDAKGCALALSFYTGPKTGGSRRDCIPKEEFEGWNNNLLGIKRFLDLAFASTDFPACDRPYAVLISFLFKALNNLPTYSGKCVRALELSPEEQAFYQEGKIFAWKSFNSSSMNDNPPEYFHKGNARFVIYSRTGRLIAPFSNYPNENEVLFAPGCTFMVMKKRLINKVLFIYIREVELGVTEKTVLCFAEKIHQKNWEHKEAFDKFRSQAHMHGINIVEKSSEAQAYAFLESPFGQKVLKVITIPQGLSENPVVTVAALVKLFTNPNFNVEHPFNRWLVQTRDEARENFYRRKEEEGTDFNLQKKQAVRNGYIPEDLDSNEPLLSTSKDHENSNLIAQINVDKFSNPKSMGWDINFGIQLDELMSDWSGGMKAQTFIIEESNKY